LTKIDTAMIGVAGFMGREVTAVAKKT